MFLLKALKCIKPPKDTRTGVFLWTLGFLFGHEGSGGCVHFLGLHFHFGGDRVVPMKVSMMGHLSQEDGEAVKINCWLEDLYDSDNMMWISVDTFLAEESAGTSFTLACITARGAFGPR